jgi:hypothetical protein
MTLRALVSQMETNRVMETLRGAEANVFAEWFCHAYVPVSELIYAAFRSNAKGLLPPSDECLRLGL